MKDKHMKKTGFIQFHMFLFFLVIAQTDHVMAGSIIPFYGDTYFVTQQITHNEINDIQPQVSGHNLAWLGGYLNHYQVFFNGGFETKQITDSPFGQSNVQISENNIVWDGHGLSDITTQIYFYDSLSKEISRLSEAAIGEWNHLPQIDGENVVWEAHSYEPTKVYLHDGSSASLISDPLSNATQPQVSENKVVWVGGPANNNEIFLFDINNHWCPVKNQINSNGYMD